MTGELIGNEIQPEGGIEEVLLPPIRAGLKRSLRERKTRLKDINYHLGRFATKVFQGLSRNCIPLYNFAIQIRKSDQSLSSIRTTSSRNPYNRHIKSRSHWSLVP